MGDHEIPKIVLSGEVLGMERESEAWKALTRKVREACERYGCFLVENYEKIPIELHEELFETTKEMFDLPLEKKLQYTKPHPIEGGYIGNHPLVPLYESFGIYGDDQVQAFQNLMGPEHGKPGFCEFLKCVNAKIFELNLLLLRMIMESYGVGEYYKSKAFGDNTVNNFRAMKYKVPKSKNEEGIGLGPHVDKTILTFLCDNSVRGLEALTQDGIWISLRIPKGALLVMVGDALEVLSNGRLQAAKHRVIMSGEKERYSCAFYTIPKDGVGIEVPQELVDEDHPLLYRPFVYSEYLEKHLTNTNFDALQVHAGI